MNNPSDVRTILRMRVRAGCEQAFERAWGRAAREISRVPGNVRQELIRDADDARTFLIVSDWTDRAAVDAFGRSSARHTLTEALRDLREDADRHTYQVLRSVPGGKGPAVRIDISTAVQPGEEEDFERAYLKVAERLRGTPGYVREELLREPGSDIYHIFAEWDTEGDFRNWVDDPSHTDQTGPLVRWLSVHFDRRIFEIAARPPTPAEHELLPGSPESSHPVGVVVSGSEVGEGQPLPSAGVGPTVPPSREVLVVGAGPAGLTCAIELARRGIDVQIIDQRTEPASQADKAIGIHCRTMEIWEDIGIVREAMDTGVWLHGQTVFVNGRQTHQVDWSNLDELPYAHLGLPQYETEQLLTARLASLGVAVDRGVELQGFNQDDTGVTAQLTRAAGGGQLLY